MRVPRVFYSRFAGRWAIAFLLDGKIAVWKTDKWDDALTFAWLVATTQRPASLASETPFPHGA
jgi:hypothetical protein